VMLGVDIGTTSTKAVAFDPDGTALAEAEAGYPLLEPEPGHAVQDPDSVLAAVEAAVHELRGALGAPIAGISVSGAMHGLLALDDRDRPITPLITWADTRATEQAARLRAEHPELQARTGTPLHPMSPLAKLLWFAERDPDAFGAARRWIGLKDLLLHRWTGEWATDHGTASGTGLLDLARLDWHPQALTTAGIRADQLCAAVPATHMAEHRDLRVPVVAGGADGPLANLGLGAVAPGLAACSIGTSGALRVTVPEPAVDPRLFCYALTPGRWIVGGATSSGGVVLDWAARALAPDLDRAALLELAAAAPPGCDGLLMIPSLLGERAPSWDATARGAYVGLTRAHGREHLLRAALEGVCLQLALVLDAMRDARHEVAELRATGGFARSALWRQMLADVLGMEIGFAQGRQASALGAALIGFEALGIEAAPTPVEIERTHRPDPRTAVLHAELRESFMASSKTRP
jgi:gluconokinase